MYESARERLDSPSCEQLFEQVSVHFHGELRRLALRLTCNHHDAEDLVQDVLARLYVHRHRLPYVRELRPWLYRVTYHQFVGLRRRDGAIRSRSAPADAELVDARDALQSVADELLTGPEHCAFLLQLRDFTALLMEQLSPEQRQAVALHELQGLSLPEIAARLGMSVNTLKSSLTRARSRLRSGLREYDPLSAHLSSRRQGRRRGALRTSRSSHRRRQPLHEGPPGH